MGYQKKSTSMALPFSYFRENIWHAVLVALTITALISAFTFTAQAKSDKNTPASGNADQTAVDAPGHSDFVKGAGDTSPNYWPGEDSASPLTESDDDVEPNFHKGTGKRLLEGEDGPGLSSMEKISSHAGRKTVTENEEESSADQGLQPLEDTSVYYHTDKVEGTEVVNDNWWSGHDTDSTYYDSSDIKISPNGKTLHNVLEFFGSDVLKRDYFKPFVMTEVDDGLYESKGELINYEFKEEFGGEKRRAVITTHLKLDEDDQFQWMVKRVDYYSRGEGNPEDSHSLVYTVWNDNLGANWNVEGDWVVNTNGNLHDMTVTEQIGDSFEGFGAYQDGPQEWTIENGEVDGDSIEMDWIYDTDNYTSNYELYATGTIDEDGNMSGTFSDTSGNESLSWHTEEGTAIYPSVPGSIYDALEDLIQAGPANMGGQH